MGYIKPVIEASFVHAGFPCVVLFQAMGHRCGYVGVPKTHPYYGAGYHEVDLNCHGGITYAENHLYGQNDKDFWWLGFDCSHICDAPDAESTQKYFPEQYERYKDCGYFNSDLRFGCTVKSLDYVIADCKNIAEELYQRRERK